MVEGFQVHLGGGLGLSAADQPGFGRKLRGLKTTSAELPAYVERLARHYAGRTDDGESFAPGSPGPTKGRSDDRARPPPPTESD